jgi:hypothetical protein
VVHGSDHYDAPGKWARPADGQRGGAFGRIAVAGRLRAGWLRDRLVGALAGPLAVMGGAVARGRDRLRLRRLSVADASSRAGRIGRIGGFLAWSACLTGIVISCGLWVRAEYQFTYARAYAAADDGVGLMVRSNEAYRAYGLDGTYRMQMALAMAKLLRSGHEVRFDESVMDRVHEIASSAAPYNPAVLLLRAEYLLNAQRCGPELDRIISHIKRHATVFPDTWQIVMFYEEVSPCSVVLGLLTMGKRVLLDQWGGVMTTFEYDEQTDTSIIGTWHDPTPVIEHNKKLATHNDGFSASRELRRIASIPTGLALQWIHEAGLRPGAFFQKPQREQNEFFRKRYMDSDYRHVRTS